MSQHCNPVTPVRPVLLSCGLSGPVVSLFLRHYFFDAQGLGKMIDLSLFEIAKNDDRRWYVCVCVYVCTICIDVKLLFYAGACGTHALITRNEAVGMSGKGNVVASFLYLHKDR